MKKLLTLCLLLIISIILPAQKNDLVKKHFPTENEKIKYQKVIEVDSTVTQEQIYLNAREWAAAKFVDSDEVIKLDTKDKLVFKGYIESEPHGIGVEDPKLWFLLTIDIKDGKFRYTLTDVVYNFYITIYNKKHETNEGFETWMGNIKAKEGSGKYKRLRKECLQVHSRLNIMLAAMKNDIVNSVAKEDW